MQDTNTIRIAFFGKSGVEPDNEIRSIFICLFEVFDKIVVIVADYNREIAEIGETVAQTTNNKEIFIQEFLSGNDGYSYDAGTIINNPNHRQCFLRSASERAQAMIDVADVIFCLPGSTTTLYELLQTIERFSAKAYLKEVDTIFIHRCWAAPLNNLRDERILPEDLLITISKQFFSFRKGSKNKEFTRIVTRLNEIGDALYKRTGMQYVPAGKEDWDSIMIKEFVSGKELQAGNKIGAIVTKLNKVIYRGNSNNNCIVGLDINLKNIWQYKEEHFRLETIGTKEYIRLLDKYLKEYKYFIDYGVNEPSSRWENIDCVKEQNLRQLFFHDHKNYSYLSGKKPSELKDWVNYLKENRLGKTLFWTSATLENRYFISAFLLLDVYVPASLKSEIEKIVSQFLLEDTIVKEAEKNILNITNFAKNAAIAQVITRTTSHNIGSHILSNNFEPYIFSYFDSKTKRNEIEADDVEAFRIYLRHRMLFNADVTSNTSRSYAAVKLKDVLDTFTSIAIIKDNISGFKDCFFEGFILDHGLGETIIALPNGVLGYHALYIIFENLIRNYFKHHKNTGHGEKSLKLEIGKLINLSSGPFYYSFDISDGSIVTNDTRERIRELIDGKILKQDNTLRAEGLGFLEIKAALCYINNIPLQQIDNPYLPDFRNEGNPIKVLSVRTGKENDATLRYRFFIPKPFIIKISQSDVLNNNLLPLGIVDCKTSTEYDSRCEYYFGDIPGNPASVTPRVSAVVNEDGIKKLYNVYYSELLDRIDYTIEIIKTVKGSFEPGGNKETLIQLNEQNSRKWSVYLDDHNFNEEYFIKNRDGLGDFYYEGFDSNTFLGKWLNDISAERKNNDFFFQKLSEVFFTKVIIIDERVQRYGEEHSKKSSFINSDVMRLAGIYIPQIKKDSLDLNNPIVDYRESLKDYLSRECQTGIFNTFILIHLGVLEKLTEDKSTEIIYKLIQDIKPAGMPDDRIVIISERGTPKNVSERFRFLHFSNVAKNLMERQGKYFLIQDVFSSRCLTQIKSRND